MRGTAPIDRGGIVLILFRSRRLRFYEFESKALMARHGIALPKGGMAKTAAEAAQKAAEIGFPVVLKSQVLSGGRMKAGGVKFADTADEARAAAEAILGLELGGPGPPPVLGRTEGR